MTDLGVIGVPEGLLLLCCAVLFGALAAKLAQRRGRHAGFWALLGCLFGPISLLALMVLPRRPGGSRG